MSANERGIATFTFAVPIWKKPWMWCGGDTYVSNLVASIGGVNMLSDRERYPSINLVEVLALRADVARNADDPRASFPTRPALTSHPNQK